jgi:hypothetical protein
MAPSQCVLLQRDKALVAPDVARPRVRRWSVIAFGESANSFLTSVSPSQLCLPPLLRFLLGTWSFSHLTGPGMESLVLVAA